MCFDIDIPNDEKAQKKAAEKLLKTLVKQLPSMEGVLAESSGKKGIHVWVMLEKTNAAAARAFGKKILQDAELGVSEHIEVFPKQDKLDNLGNLVKLPLGQHRVSRNWAWFLSRDTLNPKTTWDENLYTLQQCQRTTLPEIKPKLPLPECSQNVIPKGYRDTYFTALANAIVKLTPDVDHEDVVEAVTPTVERSNTDSTDPFTVDDFERKLRYQTATDRPYTRFWLCKTGKQAGVCPYAANETCAWIGKIGLAPLTDELKNFLEHPELHQRTRQVLDAHIVGESQLKMLLFYVGLGAAVHSKPAGIIIVDRLGGGKSHAQREVIRVFPDAYEPTSITQKAVNYLAENFAGKIVRIDEIHGMDEALPIIRSWMTEGRLEHWVAPTGEDEEKVTKRLKVEGCPVFYTSTTKPVEEEMGSRNWMARIDPTIQQTKRVHEHGDFSDFLPDAKFSPWEKKLEFLKEAVTWTMQNAKPVVNPLLVLYPTGDVRVRRDVGRFRQLMKNVANWHQLQRKKLTYEGKEYIIATKQDYEIAAQVASDYLLSTFTSLDAQSLKIVSYLREQAEPVTAKTIAVETELGYRTVKRRLDEDLAVKGCVLVNDERKPYTYEITQKGQNLGQRGQIILVDDGEWFQPYYDQLDKYTLEELIDIIRKRRRELFDNLTRLQASLNKNGFQEEDTRKAVKLSNQANSASPTTSPEQWLKEAAQQA